MLLTPFGAHSRRLLAGCLLVFALSCLYVLNPIPLHRHHESDTQNTVAPKTYLPTPTPKSPAVENFLFAAEATSQADLPPVPSFNQPKATSHEEAAPLLIGFTRNWPVLQQAVVSYITAGWPADQIFVLENTGTMNANKLGQLSLQNPFYLDYRRLTDVFGVNVVSTPTLLSFSQLQNFMIHLAIEKSWSTYFWSHMDVAILSDERYTVADKEDSSKGKYSTLFERALSTRADLIAWQNAGPENGPEEFKDTNGKWAIHYFAYDRLTLVNLESHTDVGGWDPMIGYYLTDCDFYERIHMAKYRVSSGEIGLIADVGTVLDDLRVFYRRVGWRNDSQSQASDFGKEDERGGAGYSKLFDAVMDLQHRKMGAGPGERNFWQSQQQGGQGEPYYKDAEGFERGIWMMIEAGRRLYAEKWGYRDCDLIVQNRRPADAWRLKLLD